MPEIDHFSRLVHEAMQCLNERNLEGYLNLYSKPCKFHGYPFSLMADYEEFKHFYENFLNLVPSFKVIVEAPVAQGDKIAYSYTVLAKKPKIKEGEEHWVNIKGMSVKLFHEDKCVESWNALEDSGILEQKQLLPKWNGG